MFPPLQFGLYLPLFPPTLFCPLLIACSCHWFPGDHSSHSFSYQLFSCWLIRHAFPSRQLLLGPCPRQAFAQLISLRQLLLDLLLFSRPFSRYSFVHFSSLLSFLFFSRRVTFFAWVVPSFSHRSRETSFFAHLLFHFI